MFNKYWEYKKAKYRTFLNSNISVYEINENKLNKIINQEDEDEYSNQNNFYEEFEECEEVLEEQQQESSCDEQQRLLDHIQPLAQQQQKQTDPGIESQSDNEQSNNNIDVIQQEQQKSDQNKINSQQDQNTNQYEYPLLNDRQLIIVEKHNSNATLMLKQNGIISNILFYPIQQYQDNQTSIFVYDQPNQQQYDLLSNIDSLTEMQAGQLLLQLVLINWQISQRELKINQINFDYLYYNINDYANNKLTIKLINIYDVEEGTYTDCDENCRQKSIFQLIQSKCDNLTWLIPIINDFIDYKTTPQELLADFNIEWKYKSNKQQLVYPLREALQSNELVNKQQRLAWCMQFIIQTQYLSEPITLDDIYIDLSTNELIIQQNSVIDRQMQQNQPTVCIAQIIYNIINSDVTVIMQHDDFTLQIEQFQNGVEKLLKEQISLQQFINSKSVQFTLQTLNYIESESVYYDSCDINNIEHIINIQTLQNIITTQINVCTANLFKYEQKFGKFFKLALYLLPLYVSCQICQQYQTDFNYYIYYYCKQHCSLYASAIKLQFIVDVLARIQSFDYQFFICNVETFASFQQENNYRNTDSIIFINNQIDINGQDVYLSNFDNTYIYTNVVNVQDDNEMIIESKNVHFNFQQRIKECKISNIANPINKYQGIDQWKDDEYKYIVLYLQHVFGRSIMKSSKSWSDMF